MRSDKISLKLRAALSLFALATLLTATSAFAQRDGILHSFNDDGRDGTQPRGGLVMDAAGNLYGTTSTGGAGTDGQGTVFELSPKTGGGWDYKILHLFGVERGDGNYPNGSLIIDAAGNLYGTTRMGGYENALGTVFELSPQSGGGFAEKVIYRFKPNGNDGLFPFAGLTMDSAGNLYGTTESGGTTSQGTVFELSPPSSGGLWTETILFNFSPIFGTYPQAPVIFDSAGNLYGTAELGGEFGYGTAFRLSPSSGSWSETATYSFGNNAADPDYPLGGLVLDSAGNLYGIGVDGGAFGGGAVFKLAPEGEGWSESIICAFGNNNDTDGVFPEGSLIVDSAGNLYGATSGGGNMECSASGCGTVYKLTPSGGTWTQTILHTFQSEPDGQQPEAGVISDAAGNLYGTTLAGGVYGEGTVFEIKP